MSGNGHNWNTPFLQILQNTLAIWRADTEVFDENLLQKLLVEGEHLYQVVDFGLHHEATWEMAAWVVCQTRLFASRLSQQGVWLALVARALAWCPGAGQLRVELLLVQGQLQRDANDWKAASATFAEVEPLVNSLGDLELVLRLLFNQAETYQEQVESQIAKALCLQGLDQLAEAKFVEAPQLRRWHVGLLHMLGSAQRDLGEFEDALVTLKRAVALSEHEDKLAYIRALNSLGLTYVRSKQGADAQPIYEACLMLLAETPYNIDKLLLCNNAGSLCISRQQWQDAEKFFAQAVEIVRTVPVSRKGQAITFNNMGYLLFQQNRFKEAQYFLEQAVGLYRNLDNVLMLANAVGNLGHVYKAQKNWRAAKERYDEALLLLEPWLHLPRAQSLWQEFVEPRRALD